MESADCRKCKHYRDCTVPCVWVELEINGKVPRREPLASPKRLNYLPQGDYNFSLAELAEHKKIEDLEQLEHIRAIDGDLPTLLRKKAILSMLLARMSQRDIAHVLNISQARISQIALITKIVAK